MARNDDSKQTGGAEVIISVPLSLLQELNYVSGGKLIEESDVVSNSKLSAAALGRSDRMNCAKTGRGDYEVKVVKPTFASD